MKGVLPFIDIFVPSLEEALQLVFPLEYAELQSSFKNDDIIDQIPISLISILGKTLHRFRRKDSINKNGSPWRLFAGPATFHQSIKGRGLICLKTVGIFCELWCEAYDADESRIMNANGAGDTAVAAFLSAILDGNTAEIFIKIMRQLQAEIICIVIKFYEELIGWTEMTN